MKRKFFTNLLLLISLNLLIKPFWIFGIDRTIQNTVGSEEYGLYFSLFNFSLLLNILLDLGITNYNNRNISQHNQIVRKSLSHIIGLRLLLVLAYSLITIIAGLIIGYDIRQFKLLTFLICNQFLVSSILYLRSNLSGLHHFRTDSIISVLDRLLMIFICGLLLWGNIIKATFKIEWFIYAQTVSYIITLLITIIVVNSKAKFEKLKFSRSYFVVVLKKSIPYAILALLTLFHFRIDSVMLERMLPMGKLQAGIYAQSFRVLDAAVMFSFLFASLLLPIFSKMIKEKQSIHNLTLFSFLLLVIPSIGIAIIAHFYQIEFMSLLYKEHAIISGKIFSVLMVSFVSISATYIFGTLLTANGNLYELNIIAGLGVFTNLTLNLILIPRYQALGAAYASFVTQSLIAATQIIVSKRKFGFNFNIKRIILLVIFSAGTYYISYLSIQINWYWIYKVIIIGVVMLIWAFILRLINIKLIISLLLNEDE